VNERERRYERGQEGRYRRFRRREERQIEIITLGLTLIVFMLPVLFSSPDDPAASDSATPLVLMLGGMILLAGAFFQMQRRFPVNPLTWLGGAAMLVFGVVEFQSKTAPLGPLLPILLFGGVIVGSFVTGQF
jgi:peptidoglycan/LPS O-acetylase OafA/YrhL